MGKWRTRYQAITLVAVGLLAFSVGLNPILASAPATAGSVMPVAEPRQEPANGVAASTVAALPSRVFVLDNGLVVTELPADRLASLGSISEQPTPTAGTIEASSTVLPSRLIVVDSDDNITGIWSAATGSKYSFYSLRVREQQWQGPDHPMTEGILAQYNGLLGEVDWSQSGRVYGEEVEG